MNIPVDRSGPKSKRPSRLDQEVGARIRFQRLSVGMSQEKLADLLGITFQQIQKYEKGANRIGAGRLLEISRALGVPITFFYEDHMASEDEPEEPSALQRLLATREGMALAQAFVRIENQALRQGLIVLAQAAMSASNGPIVSPVHRP
jgi:transcriptional regulator with XRE-family HTH domain